MGNNSKVGRDQVADISRSELEFMYSFPEIADGV